MLIFVDDAVAAGGAEEAKKEIWNCQQMEMQKKFTCGLKQKQNT